MSEWTLQSYAGPGPYHVERAGRVWLIANSAGLNVARTPDGVVLFDSQERAQEVLTRLQR